MKAIKSFIVMKNGGLPATTQSFFPQDPSTFPCRVRVISGLRYQAQSRAGIINDVRNRFCGGRIAVCAILPFSSM
jgi:hypothetical protein